MVTLQITTKNVLAVLRDRLYTNQHPATFDELLREFTVDVHNQRLRNRLRELLSALVKKVRVQATKRDGVEAFVYVKQSQDQEVPGVVPAQ